MARVVDFCPSSDDELPELSTLMKKPADKDSHPTAPLISPRKELVPKSASKSVSRKIRRLETNNQITGNLLFRRCDPGETREPSRGGSILEGSPRKAREKDVGSDSIFANESVFENVPPLTARTGRTKRPKTATIMEDDSEYEPQPIIPLGRLSQTRGQSRGIRLKPTSILRSGSNSFKRLGNNGAQYDQTSATISSDFSISTDESSRREGVSHMDESSVDRITDGSSYNDASYSGFSTDGSSRPFGNDSSASLPAWEPRIGELATKAPASGSINVLKPRDASSINRGAASGVKNLSPKIGAKLQSDNFTSCDENGKDFAAEDLASELANLRLNLTEDTAHEHKSTGGATPPQTPSKGTKLTSLLSPAKIAHIPKTPPRPSVDAFWSQESTNGQNDKHSPQKLAPPSKPKSPVKGSPKKDATRKAFDSEKHDVASDFLRELDTQITEGKISELAESTGGVKLVWSKTLNTTAGRANWRRETMRTKLADGSEAEPKYKHHASIELAEKVIDNEDRLLNVVAHEFCHLANFMVSGITKNPHGKEFKAWATKCSRTFGDRGVKVTTKHTYDIDFRYVWTCASCSAEYKRHSRSIDPQRHRCGTCKGTLQQTRPTPRGKGKPSEYQTFVKKQMKIVKGENPGKPQKEIMKMVAAKWANRSETPLEEAREVATEVPPEAAQEVHPAPSTIQAEVDEQLAAELIDLTLGN